MFKNDHSPQQFHRCGALYQDCNGEFSTPKVSDSCYFCLIFSFMWWFQWRFLKLTGSIDTTERNFWNFFQNFSFAFLLEKRGFDTFDVKNHAILDLLRHGIQILITRSIGPSEKSNLNFSRIFLPFPSPKTKFWSSKNGTKLTNMSQKRDFRPNAHT